MAKLSLPRVVLASLLQKNHQAIVAFERVLGDVGDVLPSTIEEAAAQANQAVAMAAQALSMVGDLLAAIEALETAPAREEAPPPDDTVPAVQIGSIAAQNADNVTIEGGTMDGTIIGASVQADAGFKKVSASDQITSTVATGSAPFVVASTTKVPNLYADRAALADTATSLGTPGTYPVDATDLPSVIALANYIKSRNTSKGV